MKNFEMKVKTYLEERGWEKLRPANVAKSIMIEGAELLEIFQWENLTPEEIKTNPEKIAAIRKELADVMLYCFDMAVILGFDTEEILIEKLEKVKAKYPPELFKNSDKEPGTEDEYWDIKNSHRREGKN